LFRRASLFAVSIGFVWPETMYALAKFGPGTSSRQDVMPHRVALRKRGGTVKAADGPVRNIGANDPDARQAVRLNVQACNVTQKENRDHKLSTRFAAVARETARWPPSSVLAVSDI
jgi:hypothetical protein